MKIIACVFTFLLFISCEMEEGDENYGTNSHNSFSELFWKSSVPLNEGQGHLNMVQNISEYIDAKESGDIEKADSIQNRHLFCSDINIDQNKICIIYGNQEYNVEEYYLEHNNMKHNELGSVWNITIVRNGSNADVVITNIGTNNYSIVSTRRESGAYNIGIKYQAGEEIATFNGVSECLDDVTHLGGYIYDFKYNNCQVKLNDDLDYDDRIDGNVSILEGDIDFTIEKESSYSREGSIKVEEHKPNMEVLYNGNNYITEKYYYDYY